MGARLPVLRLDKTPEPDSFPYVICGGLSGFILPEGWKWGKDVGGEDEVSFLAAGEMIRVQVFRDGALFQEVFLPKSHCQYAHGQ